MVTRVREDGATPGRKRKRPPAGKVTLRQEVLELPHPRLVQERLAELSAAQREARGSWAATEQYTRDVLGFDCSGVRRDFEETEPQPSVYDGYSPLAKVWSRRRASSSWSESD